jgi:hypothetical protein
MNRYGTFAATEKRACVITYTLDKFLFQVLSEFFTERSYSRHAPVVRHIPDLPLTKLVSHYHSRARDHVAGTDYGDLNAGSAAARSEFGPTGHCVTAHWPYINNTITPHVFVALRHK